MSADSPATFEELEAVDWSTTSEHLTRFAMRRLGGVAALALAEDKAQQAILQVLDPDYAAWYPARESVLSHLRKVVMGLLRNHRTKHATKNERLAFDDEPDWSRGPAAPGSLENDTIARELAALVFDQLADSFGADETEHTLVALFAEGVTERSEQVERTGLRDAEVRRARLRIERHGERVIAELEDAHVEA